MRPLSGEERAERVGFAWAGGILGQSVRSVVPWIITMPWYPLEAQVNSYRQNLGGSLEDRVDDPLS